MSDAVTGATSTATSLPTAGTHLTSSITSTLQNGLTGLSATGQSLLDRVIPPQTRNNLKQKLLAFAQTRPLLASFLLSQIALSGLPLALFLIMAITVVIFALLTGILVGLIGALVFIVLALGFALFILLPTLFVTTFFAVAVWLWCVGGYYIVKWFNEKRVPGIHRPLGEGLMVEMGFKKEEAENGGEVDGKGGENGVGEKAGQTNGTTTTARVEHYGDGKENQTPAKTASHRKKVRDREAERLSSKTPTKGITDATEGVTDVGKGITEVVS